MSNRLAYWGLITITVLALLTALLVSRYFTFNPKVFLEQQRQVYLANEFILYLHITGGFLALLIGPYQFFNRFKKWPIKFHRLLGKIYAVAVFTASIAGVYIAWLSFGGLSTHISFSLLALLWFITLLLALWKIIHHDIQNHKIWMIRNYSLTFAAVTLRLYLLIFTALFKIDFTDSYIAASWLCWTLNLIIAEIIIRKYISK